MQSTALHYKLTIILTVPGMIAQAAVMLTQLTAALMLRAATKPTPTVTMSCVSDAVAPLTHFSDVSLV